MTNNGTAVTTSCMLLYYARVEERKVQESRSVWSRLVDAVSSWLKASGQPAAELRIVAHSPALSSTGHSKLNNKMIHMHVVKRLNELHKVTYNCFIHIDDYQGTMNGQFLPLMN